MANEQVQINVGVNAQGVAAGMDAAGKQAEKAADRAGRASQRAAAATTTWQQSLTRLRAQARLFGADIVGRFTAAYGAMALVDKLINVTAESMKRATDISKASRKAGLGAEDYQRVSRIAEETGASVDEAAQAAGRYATMIREAAAGNAEAAQSLRELGFTEAQVRRGNISAIEVIAKLSKQYREAATEAERLAIAKGSGVPQAVLEAGPAAVAMAGGAGVRSAASVERRAAEQKASGRPEGFWAAFGEKFYDVFISDADRRTANITGVAMGMDELAENPLFSAAAGTAPALAPGMDAHGLRALQSQRAAATTEEEKGMIDAKLKAAFANFADDFRVAFTGTTQGGVMQTGEMVEQELQRKFVELFPQYASPAVTPGAGGPLKAGGGDGMATAVSSLQAIGGGGGFYAGATDMVSLATRTAEATEAIAKNTERLLGQRGGAPSNPAVYISAD